MKTELSVFKYLMKAARAQCVFHIRHLYYKVTAIEAATCFIVCLCLNHLLYLWWN